MEMDDSQVRYFQLCTIIRRMAMRTIATWLIAT